ncbi:hypothetical protein BAZOLSSOX_2564 [uncultured Gammaproteobacteria bacterium]|nr:hypothetical protein [uncultured Gammaproteobacteria bacterium]CAC9520476.1 hypothetical protein [uncultured Gammaproteobacteria bacterium]VVH58440.1 hypothetical protein BAZOLSSOX_2564 [uncultured Gammaproteobacteria bacterium]
MVVFWLGYAKVSFCIMCIGVIFYFWFVCRKIKGQDTVHPLD